MERERDYPSRRETPVHQHERPSTDDDAAIIDLSPDEGRWVVRLLEVVSYQEAKQLTPSEAEAILLLRGTDKVLSALRAAGY